MRHVAGEGVTPQTLRVAAEGEGDTLEQPSEPMELPLAALVQRSPQDDLSNISVGVGELSERDGDFTLTLPPTPEDQASFRHSVILGYLLDYSLL